jgi:hypothetical protein
LIASSNPFAAKEAIPPIIIDSITVRAIVQSRFLKRLLSELSASLIDISPLLLLVQPSREGGLMPVNIARFGLIANCQFKIDSLHLFLTISQMLSKPFHNAILIKISTHFKQCI